MDWYEDEKMNIWMNISRMIGGCMVLWVIYTSISKIITLFQHGARASRLLFLAFPHTVDASTMQVHILGVTHMIIEIVKISAIFRSTLHDRLHIFSTIDREKNYQEKYSYVLESPNNYFDPIPFNSRFQTIQIVSFILQCRFDFINTHI